MKKKALSLVEILVSVIILSLIIAGLANIFFAGKRYILHSRLRMTGGELGKLFLDPLQMQVRQDEWGKTGNCLSTGVCSDETKSLGGKDYTVTYKVEPGKPIDNVNKVKATISWSEPE